jgi:hypothetical protein
MIDINHVGVHITIKSTVARSYGENYQLQNKAGPK